MSDIKLPPLPETRYLLAVDGSPHEEGRILYEDGFADDDMHRFATAAILADRERTEGVMRMALEALPFVIEHRAGVWVTDWSRKGGAGCRPSTESEVQMWGAIAALREHLKESA